MGRRQRYEPDKFTFPVNDDLVVEETRDVQQKKADFWLIDEGKFLTDKEVVKLRRTAAERARTGRKARVREWFLVELGLMSGLRVGEMAALKVGDVFVDEGRCSVLVRNGKCGKRRVVLMPPEFRELFKRYMALKRKWGEPVDDGAELFWSVRRGRGMTTRALQKMFERVAAAAGLERFSVHSLRHTYATHLLRASGWNLRLVQRQLGHSSVAVTEAYLGICDPDTAVALSRLYRIGR